VDMYLASLGKLPEASDPALFQTAKLAADDTAAAALTVDHSVTDSKFRFCTEGVVLLKDGIDPKSVVDAVQSAAENDGIGDSVASVAAPAKGGGEMVKVHIHTNDPQLVFDRLQEYNRDALLKKEKVEDMLVMREVAHGDGFLDLDDAKFTIMGMCKYLLPPLDDLDELFTLPVFIVPETTQEPIDLRFASDTDACIALNQQRHKESAIRYTTAASNPMQIKIELLAALGKGKPVLLLLMSTDKRVSAIGRNAMAAIDMLDPEQRAQVRVFVHGWGFYEAIFLSEACACAHEGKTIDEAIERCNSIAGRHFSFSNLCTRATVQKLLTWRPGLFPKDFTLDDETKFISFGIPVTARSEADTPSEFQRVGMLMTPQCKAVSLSALQDAEVDRIKSTLRPGEKIASMMVQCVGRPDLGYQFVEKLKAAKVRRCWLPASLHGC